MDKRTFTPRFVFVFVIIIVSAFLRIIPHWPNFTPIAAIALFGGASLNKKWLALSSYSSNVFQRFNYRIPCYMVAVYISFIITVYGMSLLKKGKHKILLSQQLLLRLFLISPILLCGWVAIYSQDITGIISCYTMALPFLSLSSWRFVL